MSSEKRGEGRKRGEKRELTLELGDGLANGAGDIGWLGVGCGERSASAGQEEGCREVHSCG